MQFIASRWVVEERIREHLLVTAGDIVKVAKELDIDINYVKRVYKKYKGALDNKDANMIARYIIQKIMMGYEARLKETVSMFRSLEGKDQVYVCLCHKRPVVIEDNSEDGLVMLCSKTNKPCNVSLTIDKGIYNLKRNLLSDWRAEDEKLQDFAEKMGLAMVPSKPTTNIEKMQQNIINIEGTKEMNDQAKELVDMINKTLDPQDKERLIKSLERKLLETPPLEYDGETTQ